MKKIFTLLSFLPAALFAQTFSNNALTPIPNNQTDLNVPVVVQGLPSTIDPTFGVTSVCIEISHQHMNDLKIRLQSPTGTMILLADQRGGNGTGYHATCFREDGTSGFIGSTSVNFTGSYIPQASLNTFNAGENPNGTWNLVITDMFNFLDSGYAHSVDITFGVNPPATPATLFICSTGNAGGCFCPDSADMDCDLLPDMTAACTDWINPFTESPGYVYVSTATPNIGWGPLEIHGTNECYCDSVAVPCSTVTCPNGDAPKQMVSQHIYHKNGSTMTSWDRPAGTMAYHPSHGHIHVDDWIWIDVRRKTGDVNATHWPKTGLGAKQSFCLINLGSCDGTGGVCHDENGNTITNANIPNANFGSISGCSSDQGIYVGQYDTYGSILVNLPPSTCNGDYYVVSITDPLNAMLEESETNNWTVLPITLTQQLGTGSFEPEGYAYTLSGNQIDVISNSFDADSMIWEWGDGTFSRYGAHAPVASHTYTTQGTFIVGESAYNHCGVTYSQDTVSLLPTNLNSPVKTISSWTVYPNPAKDKISIDYTMVNASDLKLEITDAVGRVIKTMDNVNQNPGKYHVSLNLNSEDMKQGIYFVRLTTNDNVLNQRFVVLK